MHFRRADHDLQRHSYYADTAVRDAEHAALMGDASCDVAVVGGGLAGLSAAIELADRGLSVRLLEAGQIGSGASGRNGGQAIHGLACDIGTIEAQLGRSAARQVFDMTIEALDLIQQRCRRFGIEAGWRDGYLGVATSAAKARQLWADADHLAEHYGDPLTCIAAAELPDWTSADADGPSGHPSCSTTSAFCSTTACSTAGASATAAARQPTWPQACSGGWPAPSRRSVRCPSAMPGAALSTSR